VNQTPSATLTLLDLADIEYAKHESGAENEAAEMFEVNRKGFLSFARESATSALGSAASELQWTYTPHADLPAGVEEATAPLAPGRSEYLRYQIRHDDEVITFELVQPCSACGESRINAVSSLVDLGRLMATGGAR
jgi:hypothetical protein